MFRRHIADLGLRSKDGLTVPACAEFSFWAANRPQRVGNPACRMTKRWMRGMTITNIGTTRT